MDFDQINSAALQNYDDGVADFDNETFNSYTGANKALPMRPTRKASFDLTFVNSSAEALKVELFAALYSFTRRLRPELVSSATVTLIPGLSNQGLAAARVGTVNFNANGDLILTGAAAATALTVSCPQLSYSSLLEASSRFPFTIKAVRLTVQTPAQIDNEIVYFKKSFLGSSEQNTVSPRTSFRPDQFQSTIIDIPMDFQIDGQRGLEYKVNAGETVKWNVVIERL